jgi:hypothetical protein
VERPQEKGAGPGRQDGTAANAAEGTDGSR